jgi:DNA-binding CsgD family transcriptional regulator
MMILRRLDKPYSLPGVGCYATRTTQNLESVPLGPNHAFAARVFARCRLRFRPPGTGATSLASSTSLRVATTQPGGCCVLDRARADVARLSAKNFCPHAHHCRGNGRFSDRQLDRAGALMPILLASVELHSGAKTAIPDSRSGTNEEMQASLKSRHPRMSTRELEVAARVKAGLSARQIAADLGIAETTVITHRNGAYARMGVANLRELLLA